MSLQKKYFEAIKELNELKNKIATVDKARFGMHGGRYFMITLNPNAMVVTKEKQLEGMDGERRALEFFINDILAPKIKNKEFIVEKESNKNDIFFIEVLSGIPEVGPEQHRYHYHVKVHIQWTRRPDEKSTFLLDQEKIRNLFQEHFPGGYMHISSSLDGGAGLSVYQYKQDQKLISKDKRKKETETKSNKKQKH